MSRKRSALKPGKARLLETSDYHAVRLCSNSWLRAFDADIDEFADVHIRGGQAREPSSAKQFGTNAENWVFFGKLPDAAVIPVELESRRGAAFRKWKLAHTGQRLLTHYEARRMPKYGHYYELTEQLRAHPLARGMLWDKSTRCHVAIEWIDELLGVHRKCQIDLWRPSTWLADYKTARDIRRDRFERDIVDYGYHWQAATYVDAVELLTGERLPFMWIVQRNKPAYGVEVYEAEPDVIELGRFEYRECLERYAQCERRNHWTTETHGEAVPIGLPRYKANAPVIIELHGREIEVF